MTAGSPEPAGPARRPTSARPASLDPATWRGTQPVPGPARPEAQPGVGPVAEPAGSVEPRAPVRYRATGRYRVWLVVALQVTFRPVFRLLFRMRVEGQAGVPTTGGVIVAGNHSGFLDGPLVWLYSPRPVRFLTKAELYRQPLLARALGWLGQIPVHRGEPDRAALGEALAVLAEGGAVGVFPEGRRSDGALSEVHDGVAYLAVKSGCPVVPVACLGSGRALPRGGRRVRLRTPITVAYGSATTLVPGGGLRSRRTVAAAGAEIRGALLGHLTAVARRSGQPLPHAEEETR